MPMTWKAPAMAFSVTTNRGQVEIFHTYANGCGDCRSTYYFTTHAAYDDRDCGEDCIFDIRDLPCHGKMESSDLIAYAINTGALKHPDDLDY